jgi:hypothetical protein
MRAGNSAADKPVTNGVRVNADIYQELLRQDVVSWVPEEVS